MVRRQGYTSILLIILFVLLTGTLIYIGIKSGLPKRTPSTYLPPDLSIRQATTSAPQIFPQSENSFTIDKYSFTLPSDFVVRSKNINTGISKEIDFVNPLDVEFKVIVNEGGRGLQCVTEIESSSIVISGKSYKKIVYQGLGATDAFPNCDRKNKYDIWIILKELEPPKEGIDDLIWFSFDTSKVEFAVANQLLNQIISSFRIAE